MLLIDGYNLLFASRRGRIERHEFDRERERFVHLLLTFCKLTGKKAIVVFDHTKGPPVYGIPVRHNLGELEYRFTTEDITADQEMITMLEGTGDRTAYTVVTSDREIIKVAEKHKFKCVASADFAEEVARVIKGDDTRGPERILSKDEVDFWLKEFGIDEP